MARRTPRLALVVFIICFAPGQVAPGHPPSLTREQALADFGDFWREIRDHYAYFEKKRIRWPEVRNLYHARAAEARTRLEMLRVLEDAIAELYDDHATLGADAPGSPRIVPSRTDVWGSWHGKAAVLDEVRPRSVASASGLRAGDEVLAVHGISIAEAVSRELPRSLAAPDRFARDWALRRTLAGRRGETIEISVRHADGQREIVRLADNPGKPDTTLLEHRRLDQNTSYIRFHNSLGNSALVSAFDDALEDIKDVPALVVDLRDTPGGGDSAVAEPILGRFIDRVQGYQKFVVPVGDWRHTRAFVEKVHPRGPFTFRGKIVVLVDHWTASMGEGMAVGLAVMRQATVVGTPMAGLNGATYTRHLRFSGITYSYPAERIYTINGTPREDFRPNVIVSILGSLNPDPVLNCALAVLNSTSGSEDKVCSTKRATCAE